MKYILTLLMLICVLSVFAQKKINGKITYKVINNVDIKTDTIKEKSIKYLLNKMLSDDNTDNLILSLIFNNEASYFYMNEKLESKDAFKINPIKIEIENRGDIFTNIKQKVSYSKNIDLQNTLIKDSLYFNWELTKEKKNIQGFTCYKAIGERKIYKRKLDKYVTNKVIAWYSPKINISTGPLGYGNLPGLILELTETDLFTIVCAKIAFDKKINLDKYFKSNNEVINRDDYNRMKRKIYLDRN